MDDDSGYESNNENIIENIELLPIPNIPLPNNAVNENQNYVNWKKLLIDLLYFCFIVLCSRSLPRSQSYHTSNYNTTYTVNVLTNYEAM